jgi:DNA-directed RNA polymerase specialized sigma24 family protein
VPPVPALERALAGARDTARRAFQSLREPDRRALEEAYFRGTSAREVAVLIGTPTSEAGATLRSALVRFREHVAEGEAVSAAAGGAS